MLIFPAIDIYQGCAVRLYKGDYSRKTVYSTDPAGVALDFVSCGADHIHLVDLEGARNGMTPNFDLIKKIKEKTGVFCQTGGGIRTVQTAQRYIEAGIDRVIFGTSALRDPELLCSAVRLFGDKVAVSIDVRDGKVAVSGWLENTATGVFDFCRAVENAGVSTVICTDISRDGAMKGSNGELYRQLSQSFGFNIIASGGVSSIGDVTALKDLGLYGAIIGKAYYTGAISLREAIGAAC